MIGKSWNYFGGRTTLRLLFLQDPSIPRTTQAYRGHSQEVYSPDMVATGWLALSRGFLTSKLDQTELDSRITGVFFK